MDKYNEDKNETGGCGAQNSRKRSAISLQVLLLVGITP